MCYTYGMRLALACLSLAALPAMLLIAAAWTVGTEDHRFWTEAREHLAHLDQARQMDPAAVRRAPFAPEILTFTDAADGADVRARVCGPRATVYDPLFPDRAGRCAHVTLFRRVRRAAVLSLILPALTVIVLVGVKLNFERPLGASVLALWIAVRGIHLLLLGAAVGSIATGAILLESLGSVRYAIAAAGCLGLFLWSRRRAKAYLGPIPQRRYDPAKRRKRRGHRIDNAPAEDA